MGPIYTGVCDGYFGGDKKSLLKPPSEGIPVFHPGEFFGRKMKFVQMIH